MGHRKYLAFNKEVIVYCAFLLRHLMNILPPLLNRAHKELISVRVGQPSHLLFNAKSIFLQKSFTIKGD